MTRQRRAVTVLAIAGSLTAASACQVVDGVPRVKVRFDTVEQSVEPAVTPTTMYAPIPKPKTPCDEYPVERAAEPQGCYVPVPHE